MKIIEALQIADQLAEGYDFDHRLRLEALSTLAKAYRAVTIKPDAMNRSYVRSNQPDN